MTGRSALALLACLLVSCGPRVGGGDDDDAAAPDDDDDEASAPRIAVTPPSLNFDVVDVGESLELVLTISNVGGGTLQVEGVALSGAGGFELDGADDYPVAVAAGGATELVVRFAPAMHGSAAGSVVVTSDDEAEPEVTVSLLGAGRGPMIELEPSAFDFGNPSLGCAPEVTVAIRNVGSAALLVEAVAYEDTAGNGELSVEYGFEVPVTLAPADWVAATVTYVPSDPTADSGWLHITSTDPTSPEVSAHQFGIAHLGEAVIDAFVQSKPEAVTFPLSATPLDGSLVITFDAYPVPIGWTYDPETNSVTFDHDMIPESYSYVELAYNAVVCE